MDLKKIESLVRQKESKTLEFKKSTGLLHSIFATISAFLNGSGGTVLVGVTDNQQIVGQDISDRTRIEIANEIKKIEPSASIEVEYIAIRGNKFVIVIHVDSGKHAPYLYDGRAYQRDESQTNKMSQHQYEQLLVNRRQINHSWEKLFAHDYTLNDLDDDEIKKAVKQGMAAGRIPETAEKENIEEILASWNLIQDEKIKNAAVILFAKKTMPHYPQCHLKLARFRGTDMLGDYIDNKDFYGNAFRIFDEANSFVMRHLPIASFFEPDNFQRIDRPALPVSAVREALVNAICHGDYSNRSTSITLAIFDDRMEIWNYGKLPSDLTINKLQKKHRSEPRNKLIAKVFYDRKFFEGWGTGTVKIFDLCREDGLPEPMYEQYSGGTEIIFRFKEPIAITKSPPSKTQILSTRQEEILRLLQANKPLSSKEIFTQLRESPSLRTMKKDLLALQKHGLVQQQGKSRNIVWTVS